jgi:hypothetical protein
MITDCKLLTHIKGAATIRKYNKKYNKKCKVNLLFEYNYIVKYSRITLKL